MISLEAKNINVCYGKKTIIKNLDFKVQKGDIVTIVGPNGSGKSTLIKALSRLIKITSGDVELYGKDIYKFNTKKIAQEMAILPQIRNINTDLTVENLVSYGRQPHLKFGKRIGKDDEKIVEWAMKKTRIYNLKDRCVSTLSGGERQRAWISMALAQKPSILILDEPTTFLDISYQLEVLEVVKELNKSLNITVIMVLHDLNQAIRYSDNIYVLKQGEVCNFGKPNKVMTLSLIKEVFSIDANIYQDEINNCPYIIPQRLCDLDT
ncbi:ABC transporter ATP-binding protein [Clostridium algidicarnis]|uniref:ABC transporter ATP-binding protein n=1 Tax=Clostridium algidicarnis TaxID=37659 RepID=UPI003FD6C793